MNKPIVRRIVFASLVGLIAVLTLWWPGDAPFINDEPNLFLLAYDSNQHHQLAKSGLHGTVGLSYGPIPVWVYQIITKVTSSPENWVLIKAAVMFSMITCGLFLLSRALNLWVWFLPIVLVSPYIWFYSRHLWDNTFLLPLSALALGAYAYFLEKKSTVFLFIAIVIALTMPLIHLMALPLVITLVVHSSIFARKELWRLRFPVLGFLLVIIIMHAPYISSFINLISNYHPHQAQQSTSQWMGWVFPFLGGRLLSACGLEYIFEQNWFAQYPLFAILSSITGVIYLTTIGGLYIEGKEVHAAVIQPPKAKRSFRSNRIIIARSHMALIALTVFALQIIMCGVTHSFFHPHYYGGQWIINVLFAWIIADKIAKVKYGKAIVALYGIVLFSVLIIIINLVHLRGGTRGSSYGPTIANQLAIAASIGSDNRSDIYCNVPNFVYSSSINALRILCVKDNAHRMKGPLLIDYTTADTRSGFTCIRSNVPHQ